MFFTMMMMIFVINVFRRQGCPHLGQGHGPIVSSCHVFHIGSIHIYTVIYSIAFMKYNKKILMKAIFYLG